jgi:hypothetical protein
MYLYEVLRRKCGQSPEAVSDALSQTTFIHPYGHIGLLRWQTDSQWVQFGVEGIGDRLAELAGGITTFHEQVASEREVDEIQRVVFDADRIVFLGFGYHEMNMELLYPTTMPEGNTIFGITFGMTKDNIEVVDAALAARLAGRDRRPANLRSLNCAEFLAYFDRRLSYS